MKLTTFTLLTCLALVMINICTKWISVNPFLPVSFFCTVRSAYGTGVGRRLHTQQEINPGKETEGEKKPTPSSIFFIPSNTHFLSSRTSNKAD